MSLWTFSPSVEEEVNKCIAAAQPPGDSNKWIQRFGHKNYCKPDITSIDLNQDKTLLSEVPTLECCVSKEEDDLNKEHFDELLDAIQTEPVGRFKLLVTECMSDHRLFSYLANKLSINTVEKIINHIYENKELDYDFIEKCHNIFIPCLLRKEHGWFTLNMLIRSYRIYPKAFETLLKIVVRDVQISNKVLHDLIDNFNEKELNDVLNVIMELELSTEEFSHNIFSIYTAYKSCKKTMEVQNWIFKQLLQHGSGCVNDKSYGKLLLSFLQAERESQSCKNYSGIEKILNTHRSTFKRPCMNLLQELLDKCNSMDTSEVSDAAI